MALVELKYNDTTIYVEDELNEEELGVAIQKKENLEKTQEFKPISNNDFLEDTITMEPIGDDYE